MNSNFIPTCCALLVTALVIIAFVASFGDAFDKEGEFQDKVYQHPERFTPIMEMTEECQKAMDIQGEEEDKRFQECWARFEEGTPNRVRENACTPNMIRSVPACMEVYDYKKQSFAPKFDLNRDGIYPLPGEITEERRFYS